jgi:predicted transcriptional regulator
MRQKAMPMANETTERLIVFLPPVLHNEAKQLAAHEDRSMSAIARRAIQEYMRRECKTASKK